MASSSSAPNTTAPLHDQIAEYYTLKQPYTSLLAAASSKISSPTPDDIAAAYHKPNPNPSARPPHKDNLFPDPVNPRKTAPGMPERKKRTGFDKEMLATGAVDWKAIEKMISGMREGAREKKGPEGKEEKEVWKRVDGVLQGGLGFIGKQNQGVDSGDGAGSGTGGGSEDGGKGKRKGKK